FPVLGADTISQCAVLSWLWKIKLTSDERSSLTPISPTFQTVHLSSPASATSYRCSPQRPESFLFRAAVREDVKRSNTPPPASSDCTSSKIRQEELDVSDQLRKPKLKMAKCRRNVENFLEACKKIGVPQLNLGSVSGTLESLLSFGDGSRAPALSSHLLGFGVFYCTLMLLLFMLYRWFLTFWTQGKHRVTKRGPALSNPMFTLVTSEDIVGSVSHTPIQRCLQGVQR
ncbi:unnamed protein product, partial [Ranitomeya imitator]